MDQTNKPHQESNSIVLIEVSKETPFTLTQERNGSFHIIPVAEKRLRIATKSPSNGWGTWRVGYERILDTEEYFTLTA